MGAPMIAYPAVFGGKYHARSALFDWAWAQCGPIELDPVADPIHVSPGQDRIHPVVCKRCLRNAGLICKQAGCTTPPAYERSEDANPWGLCPPHARARAAREAEEPRCSCTHTVSVHKGGAGACGSTTPLLAHCGCKEFRRDR